MLFKETVTQAWASIVAHRFRAGLTMLGIAWGILTVASLMAYGNGFHRAMFFGFANAFSNGVAVIYGGQTSMQAGGERAGRRVFLKEADIEPLRQLGLVKYVSPEIFETLPLSYGTRATSAGVRGVAPEYGVMRTETPSEGRFINAEDVERRRRVAFLGTEVARNLFGNSPAVGQTIRIRGLSFEVVGVLIDKAQLSSYFWPDKRSVFIPHSVTDQLFHQDYLDTIVVQTIAPAFHEQGMKQVKAVLAERHRFDARDDRALVINDSAEIRRIFGGMTTGLKIVLVFIGTLTLDDRRRRRHEHHAGVGERADEGDRRAEGARRAAASHPAAVPARGARHHRSGRGRRHPAHRHPGQRRRQAAVPGAAHRRPDRRDRHQPHPHAGRADLDDGDPDADGHPERPLARAARGPPRPHRVAPVRVATNRPSILAIRRPEAKSLSGDWKVSLFVGERRCPEA